MEKLRPEQLREKANMLPLLPGVYIMLDEHGEVIYIGKAKALKNRVTSYFRGEHLPKVAAMVAHVADFNVIVVQSEFEALVLENSLIKLHKPKYNILLKDDKGYPLRASGCDAAVPDVFARQPHGKGRREILRSVRRAEHDGGDHRYRVQNAAPADVHAPLPARHRACPPVPELPHGHLRRLLPEGRYARGVSQGHSRGGDDP